MGGEGQQSGCFLVSAKELRLLQTLSYLPTSPFASAVMPFAQRCHRVSNSERRLTGFNNAASFFIFFLHASLPQLAFPASAVFSSSENLPSHQTHTPVPHCQPPPLHSPTLFPAQPLSKGSDWMMQRCRYPAPLKSILLSASVAPAPLLPFPRCPTPLPSSSWDPSVRSDSSPFGVAVGCTLECSNYPSK